MDHPKHILEQHHIEAKKSLGQNFLFDENVLAQIAAAADLATADQVLEIGPGLGHLTQHLATRAGRVVAVELDGRLIPLLRMAFSRSPQVELVHGDVLELNPAAYFGDASYKVVANVPYYITGGILRHLLTSRPRPSLLVMTVQQEVARRLTAQAGDMSLLAVSVRVFGVPRIVTQVKAGAFWPRPKVDSAVVRVDFSRGDGLEGVDEALFFRVARAGFSQKRKQLKNNLTQLGLSNEAVARVLGDAGIDGTRRAQTLSIAEWVALTRAVARP
ncbi:MAG: ribosomal RNA small subunit methyltransferase A [Ardenticatenales bacterium]|nr:ribosomal RNA small subunit methyltransferase A [Ardenticatenales bacterium]